MTSDPRRKHVLHPLAMAVVARGWPVSAALNWLQDHGHISDLCVTIDDVPACDTARILHCMGATWALPAQRYLEQFGSHERTRATLGTGN